MLLDGGGGPFNALGVVAVQQGHRGEQDEADQRQDWIDGHERDH